MISILIVNWNGMRYMADCLRSIRAVVTGDYEVIVVDNNSSDGSPDWIAAEFPWVKLIRSPENLGFGRGNNLAVRHASGETLMLLNYDTVLLADPAPLAAALARDKSIGCIGAKMCNGDGVVVANCGHFPSPLRLLLFSSLFWSPYQGSYGPNFLGADKVDWVEGSFMLIRRDTWDAVKGFDERIFMYGEDIELCRRIANLGQVVVQASTLAYRHYTGWSVHRMPSQYAGFLFYHQTHSRGLERALAEVVLFLGLKARLLSYALLGLLTRQPRFIEKAGVLRGIDNSWKGSCRAQRLTGSGAEQANCVDDKQGIDR